LLRLVTKVGARPKMEVPMYEGNLNVEELLDWINAMDKYFDYEDIDEEKKVKHVVTRMKGHATLWWDELQADKRRKGKAKIKSWDRMVAKFKAKFMPKDYQLNLFRKLQNLRQKGMSVKEYTEEFYRLNIRAGHVEDDAEKVSRYINGIRYEIQDEISLLTLRTVEDAYQAALKAEEKLARKQSQRTRGRSQSRGKGSSRGRFQNTKEEAGNSSSQSPREGESRGRRFFSRGRGRGREIRCYTCGKTGHMSWDCPENKSTNPRGAHIAEAQENTTEPTVKEETPEIGEALMLKRVLIKEEK
jgi:hypothetical protein